MFYTKKTKRKLFGDFAPTPSPGHHPGPPGPLRPPAAIVLASSKINAAIFFLHYPLELEAKEAEIDIQTIKLVMKEVVLLIRLNKDIPFSQVNEVQC